MTTWDDRMLNSPHRRFVEKHFDRPEPVVETTFQVGPVGSDHRRLLGKVFNALARLLPAHVRGGGHGAACGEQASTSAE